MSETFVLDASACIAFLMDEEGADRVEQILRKASAGQCDIVMHSLNLLEVYYGVYRDDGREMAEKMLVSIRGLPIKFISELTEEVFREAGRFKATCKVSFADAIVLAVAKTRNGSLLTSDHHEFDVIDRQRELQFSWIR